MIFQKSGNRNVSTPWDGNETHGFGSSLSFAPDGRRWEPFCNHRSCLNLIWEFMCASSGFKSHPWVTRRAFKISHIYIYIYILVREMAIKPRGLSQVRVLHPPDTDVQPFSPPAGLEVTVKPACLGRFEFCTQRMQVRSHFSLLWVWPNPTQIFSVHFYKPDGCYADAIFHPTIFHRGLGFFVHVVWIWLIFIPSTPTVSKYKHFLTFKHQV
jgi:hypothetical protein